jgi:hypothetical protein
MTKLKPHAFLMLRKPLLSINYLTRVNRRIKKDPHYLQKALVTIYRAPLLREALYLASPGLYQQLLQVENFTDQPYDRKVLISLYKYLVRATSRCTPFGLFAGYSIVSVGEYTQIEFNGKYRKHTTLGAHLLQVIGDSLSRVYKKPRLRINSSLYAVGSNYRFFYRETASAGDAFALLPRELKSDPWIETVFRITAHGASRPEIESALTQTGVSKEYARIYIERLWEEQVLVGGMEPAQSNSRFQKLIDSSLHPHAPQAKVLASARALNSGKSHGPLRLANLEHNLKAALIDPVDAIQIDLEFQTKTARFNRKIACEIIADVSKVLSLQAHHLPAPLKAFAARFYNRYGQRRVPLMQALDPDSGIGYGNYKNLPFGHFQLPAAKKLDETHSKNAHSAMLERIYQYTQKLGRQFYILGPDELDPPKETPLKVAEGFSLIGTIICESQRWLDTGNFFFDCRAAVGPGSMNLISRFADADQPLAMQVRAAKAKEAACYEDSVLAEIQYVPPGRDANLTRRPVLGEYQIPIMSAPAEGVTTIHLSDLLVSVENGEVIIYSKTLAKRVRPRATTAYNPRLGPEVYQFLADVSASEGTPGRLWDWGHLSENAFLPRIQVGKTIISRAYWNLPSDSLIGKQAVAKQMLEWWQGICKLHRIPRWVNIGSGDRQLLIDGCTLLPSKYWQPDCARMV